MRCVSVLLLLLLGACGKDASSPEAIGDFDVSVSLGAAAVTLKNESGTWTGCQTTWTFVANDSRPTVHYSVGPGLRTGSFEWWENGDFRGRGVVSLFVPSGREIAYSLRRVENHVELWKKESGLRQVSC